MTRIRILIIDDSATARAALRASFADVPELEVVGEAADGAQALRLVKKLAPDLITMDVFLRAESGLDLAASIMEAQATPIVVVTAANTRDPGLVFRAMQAGALEVCAKLPGPRHPDYAQRRAHLIRTLRTLAKVPVVHRRSIGRGAAAAEPAQPREARLVQSASVPRVERPHGIGAARDGLLLLGASTGGPPVLARLLRALPRPFPLPIAIVQHIVPGFIAGFATWLENDTGHPVSLVGASRLLEAGTVYLADSERHLVIEPAGRIGTSVAAARGFYRPSVDMLFESAAASVGAARSIAVLCTGMGTDGASGLLALRKAGALTLAQAPEHCAVPSMPAHAIALEAPLRVLPTEQLAPAVMDALRQR